MRLWIPYFNLKEAFRYTVHFLNLQHALHESLLAIVYGMDEGAHCLFPP